MQQFPVLERLEDIAQLLANKVEQRRQSEELRQHVVHGGHVRAGPFVLCEKVMNA